MNKFTKATAFGALLLFGAAGCTDLEVKNPNDPDRGGALANPSDVESLVSGSFNSWYSATHTYYVLPLSSMSFQHSAPWANFGMHNYSLFPRASLINSPTDGNYTLIDVPWSRNYRAIAAAAEGMRAINNPETGIADQLGADRVTRANAFGKFVLGMAHASVAVLYDQGFVVDETTDLTVEQEPVSSEDVMAAAIGYFQEAIDLATANDFDIPSSWVMSGDGEDVPADEFARMAHSYRAAFRASMPRTPEERSSVDWDAVLADIDAGVEDDWFMNQDYYAGWYNSFLDYGTWESWQQIPYFLFGMGDTSGNYQTWLNTPLADRQPIIDGEDILIVTPDERFPQGSTLAEQEENPGTKLFINAYRGSNWAQAARGTWRWSYYHNYEHDPYNSWSSFVVEDIEREELDLLAAEAYYWKGDYAAAAALINKTRVAAGLNATDAAGTNTSCVPKLPDGSCGDLLEMLKWEKRLEVWHTGMVYGVPFYFDSRRWGDHYVGTTLEFPIPGGELQTLQMPSYSFGGVGGESASGGSSYAWPSEG